MQQGIFRTVLHKWRNRDKLCTEKMTSIESIDLKSVLGVFILLGGFVVIGLLTLICEIIVAKLSNKSGIKMYLEKNDKT